MENKAETVSEMSEMLKAWRGNGSELHFNQWKCVNGLPPRVCFEMEALFETCVCCYVKFLYFALLLSENVWFCYFVVLLG